MPGALGAQAIDPAGLLTTSSKPAMDEPLPPAPPNPVPHTRLIIADDHRVVTEGLRRILEPVHTVVAVVHSGDHVIPLLRTTPADCLLLDVMMPGQNGYTLLPQIRDAQPALKVVVLTMFVDRLLARECLAAGAHAFVPKDADGAELLGAIATVLAGGTYLSPRVPKITHRVGLAARVPGFEPLTPRRQEIVELLGHGLRPAEIADQLGIGRSTVTFHLRVAEETLGLAPDGLREWLALMADPSPPPHSPASEVGPDGTENGELP